MTQSGAGPHRSALRAGAPRHAGTLWVCRHRRL